MKSSTRMSLFAALVFNALSLQLSGCGPQDPTDAEATSSISGALSTIRAGGGAVLSDPGKIPPSVVTDPCYPQPQLTFASKDPAIAFGGSTTLSWSAEVPEGCPYTIELSEPAEVTVELQSSRVVWPSHNTTYILALVWGPNRAHVIVAKTYVSVALPTDPLDPNRKLVTLTEPASLDLFLQALSTENTTVVVNSAVTLDLSNVNGIVLNKGVRLVGGRSVVPGAAYDAGPLLYTNASTGVQFVINQPGVRITGFRIQGRLRVDPPEVPDSDGDASKAISIGWSARGGAPAEIDHNEIYGWSCAGVEVVGDIATPRTVQTPAVGSHFQGGDNGVLVYDPTPEQAYVHDNYIHHNLHAGKLGYGVTVGGNGAHALIERNVFDWNRHAISGDGSDASGYRAYRNLVLEHGGYDVWMWWVGLWQFTHQFDMHGQDSYCLTAFLDHDCGTAGHDIDIQQNSFFYTSGRAIKVRGTPQLGAVIRSNVFAGDSHAIDHTEDGVYIGDDNQLSAGWHTTDACDFDGDGNPDRFLATGQTWWFSSNAGQGPWIFLKASAVPLGNVVLGEFDGDRLCDVAADGVIYSGGTHVSHVDRARAAETSRRAATP